MDIRNEHLRVIAHHLSTLLSQAVAHVVMRRKNGGLSAMYVAGIVLVTVALGAGTKYVRGVSIPTSLSAQISRVGKRPEGCFPFYIALH